MDCIPLKTLKPCKCGGRPTIKRDSGWWHICCKKCGWYPFERMYGSDHVRVYGWNTRNEAIHAWEKGTETPEGKS